MLQNLNNMATEILCFLVINLTFMYVLRRYMKRRKRQNKRLFARIYIQNNLKGFFKISCAFALLYFSVFIIFSNSRITCKDLDKSARCACYALEAKHSWISKWKVEWAKEGLDQCPDSNWFPQFIKDHS